MSTDETATLLQAGIAAAKAGERGKARELLQRVVAADESNLQAWLWLSDVVNTLEDQEVCLENVLTLDPDNATARKGLDWVRAQITATPEIEPISIFPHVEMDELRQREARVSLDFSNAELDDPLLCVYCAHPTSEEDKACPNCHRSLYVTVLKREKPVWVWVGWTVGFVEAFYSLGLVLLLTTILAYTVSAANFGDKSIETADVLAVYFGQPGSISKAGQAAIFSVMPREVFFFRLGYALVTALATVGLVTRQRVFHLLYVAGMTASVVSIYYWTTLNRVLIADASGPATPLQGILQVALNELLGIFSTLSSALAGGLLVLRGLMALLMDGDFDKVTERLWCVIDKTVREPTTAFVRAKAHMRHSRWTLAALYVQRAITLQPSIVEYQLALAEIYARLKRYPQSLQLLDQAERLAPDTVQVQQLRDVITQLAQRAAPPETKPDPAGGL
ncbi:MAG: tetratricopeptide repeat protein [Thermoflexales bacterium]|nr:tetratricopeptide repeat protein [Thermoflexales bacterium]